MWVGCHELWHTMLTEFRPVPANRIGFTTPGPSVRPGVPGKCASSGGFPAAASRNSVSYVCLRLLKFRGASVRADGSIYAMSRA